MKLLLLSLKTYFKKFPYSLALGFSFLVVALCCLSVGLFSPILIIVTGGLLLIPFYTAFLISCTAIRHGEPLSNRLMLNGVKKSYSVFSNLFSTFFNLIKAILIGFGTYFVFSFGYLGIASIVNPEWAELIRQLEENASSMSVNQIYEYLTQNKEIYRFLQICLLTSFGAGVFSFIFSIGYRSINLFVRGFFLGIPKQIVNYFYKQNMKNIRFKYLGDYLVSSFPFGLLFIGGYILGAYLGLNYKLDTSYCLVLAVASGFTFLSLFLAAFGYLVEFLANKYMRSFLVSSISSTENLIDLFKSKGLADQVEPLEQMKQSLKARLDLNDTLDKKED